MEKASPTILARVSYLDSLTTAGATNDNISSIFASLTSSAAALTNKPSWTDFLPQEQLEETPFSYQRGRRYMRRCVSQIILHLGLQVGVGSRLVE